MTSTPTPASRPPATSQRGGTHTHTGTPWTPSPHQPSHEDRYTESWGPSTPQGSWTRQHPWVGSQNMCQRAGWCSNIHFDLSLSYSTISSCFNTTTIIRLPKKNLPTCLNDYRTVALTLIIMKCSERVVLSHIQSSIHHPLDPLQYIYRPNGSTSDAIAAVLHYFLSHLENKDSYIRTRFVDYSFAFNTVISHKLTDKLSTLGLHSTICDWLLNFLTGRPHSVRIGNRTLASIITINGTPQGSILSPILYTLFTCDRVTSHKVNTILKFADDTTGTKRPTEGRWLVWCHGVRTTTSPSTRTRQRR